MIDPELLGEAAKKKENENFRFRAFLKRYGNEKKLDLQFLELHKELFAVYDCSKCRNCCKMYRGCIPEEDLDRDARHLGITREQFIDFFLEKDELGSDYQTRHIPCDFLQADGDCRLGECRPDSCKKYPYTDQPERLWNLLTMVEAAGVCPVVYEIFERLKQEYRKKGK